MERDIPPPLEGHWDPTGRTQALAATALIEALTPRIFKVSPAGTQGLTL